MRKSRKRDNVSYEWLCVTGIDLAEAAISSAKAKTIERRFKVNFVVGNVLQMNRLFMGDEFDVIIDSACFMQ